MRLEMQTQTFNGRLRTEALTVLQIHTSVFSEVRYGHPRMTLVSFLSFCLVWPEDE